MPACKCRYCQTNIGIKDSYLHMLGKQKAYFCNEEHYNLFVFKKEEDKRRKEEELELAKQKKQEEHDLAVKKRKEEKDKVYYLICEIIGRKEIINTVLWREWKEWNKVAPNATIGKYLEEDKNYLCSIVSKLDNNEFLRIRYLSAILKNKLGDYKPKVVVRKEIVPKIQDEHYETKFKLRQRKGLDDLEDDCDE